MYIIVIGGGRVGYYLSKALINEGHEVTIVEKENEFCQIINDELGGVCVHGDGCEAATLTKVGTNRADLFIAVTGDDEDNLVSCQVAKHKFEVPRIIARIRNPQNEVIFKKLGIDITVSSTTIILENIEEEVLTQPLTHLVSLRDKGLEIVEIKVPAESAVIGKHIKETSLPEGSRIALIIPREGRPHLPSPDSTLGEGDKLIAITTPEAEESLREALTSA